MIVAAIALSIFAYLFGSIPFGLIISKTIYGVDIRSYGSGNIGATNVYRIIGSFAGLLVFAADFLKGFIPVFLAKYVIGLYDPSYVPLVCIIVGFSAIMGHSYSIFMKFNGGKGMSTAAGLVAALWPLVALILFIIWISVIGVTRYVSLASMIIAILFPFLILIINPKYEYIGISFIIAVIVVFRHRSNIKRLIEGTELKMGKK